MNEKVEKMRNLQLPVTKDVIALGIPMGRPEYVQQQLEKRAQLIQTFCERIEQLHDNEVAFHMLVKSATAKADYHVRILQPKVAAMADDDRPASTDNASGVGRRPWAQHGRERGDGRPAPAPSRRWPSTEKGESGSGEEGALSTKCDRATPPPWWTGTASTDRTH